MIGKLTGFIQYRADDHILLEVKGVGYLIYCSEMTLMNLPGTDQLTSLYTELVVREDLLQIFGFLSLAEKEWHRLLMSVQGVGAKASLAILGTLGADGVSRAIALGDWSAVKAAKGIGPKTAQRVVNELKDKAPRDMEMRTSLNKGTTEIVGPEQIADPLSSRRNPGTDDQSFAQADVMSALCNLGYSASDAATAIAKVMVKENNTDTKSLILSALKLLAPKD